MWPPWHASREARPWACWSRVWLSLLLLLHIKSQLHCNSPSAALGLPIYQEDVTQGLGDLGEVTYAYSDEAPNAAAPFVTSDGTQVDALGGVPRSEGDIQELESETPLPSQSVTDIVSVLDYGAISDGSALTTQAFNRAVRDLSSRGGGTLRVPAGTYVVSTIYLASNITVSVEKGATILASTEADDWEAVPYTLSVPQCYGVPGEQMFKRYGGPVLYCVGCDNVVVKGEGMIDGQGSKWWKNPDEPRGYLVFFVNSTNIAVTGMTFQNSAAWNIVPKFCTNVTVDDVKIYNHYVQGHNTDGVNPYGSKNVRITNTVIVTGDDCIAVKSGPRPSCGIPSENILVYNVTCVGSHGLTIGSEMNAGVRNVHFANITIDGRNTPSSQGVRLKSQRGRGGFVENILYENIRIHNVKIGIQATLNYRDVDPSLRPIPRFSNITIRNVYGTQIRRTFGSIDGLPDAPIEGIHLENIYLFGESKTTSLVCKDATDATFSLVFPPPKVTGSCTTQWRFFVADFLGLNWSGLPRWFSMHLLNWFW